MRIPIPYLRPVGALEPFEVNVGALSRSHLGMTIGAKWRSVSIAGRMRSLPQPSMTKPLLVVEFGEGLRIAMHPADAVLVVPDGYQASIAIERADIPGGDW